MTGSVAGDVRGFYKALGIELPAWSQREAPVRCFAEPDAHQHGDRSPSCSINLMSGAWNCHGCGAAGGAYDAALALGQTPRSAMELLIACGLAEARRSRRRWRSKERGLVQHAQLKEPVAVRRLSVDEAVVEAWAGMLEVNTRLLWRLLRERAWTHRVIRELKLGFDGARITIPIRGREDQLRGVLRYDPFAPRTPKVRAVAGTRLGLIPHPERERSREILLVEGPPDAIAARSCGLAAIAVPGTNAWRSPWGRLFAGRHVTIVMDCDEPGREAAHQIATDLEPFAAAIEIVDLWPGRDDGYDLTDRILERRRASTNTRRLPKSIGVLLEPHSPSPRRESTPRVNPSTKETA
jgi:Toprim domain